MKLKKMITGVIAAAMVLSMSTTVFANGVDTTKDMPTVTITKSYEAANAGTTSPEETFNFTIERTSVSDAAEGVTKENMPLPTIGSVSYTQGEAGSTSKAKDITVELPPYASVGIYTYTIKETAGDTAGVTYRGSDIRLVVTVQQGEDGFIRIAAVHTETAGGDKTNSFDDNKYEAGSLSVKKNVTGNMGDRQKDFKVTVAFTAPAGKTVKGAITYTDGTNENSIAGNWKEMKTVDIYLKHGETVTFSNIPYGVTYTVEEDDYTGEGYDAASYKFEDQNKKIDTATEEVEITNNKGTSVDTGINLDSLPYIMILAVVAIALVAFFGKKRMARNN